METSLSRLLAAGLRDVVPQLAARGLGYTFGEHTAGWRLPASLGGDAQALSCSLNRWLQVAAGLLDDGFVALHAGARAQTAGGCTLQVRIGGTGQLHAPGLLGQAIEALGLEPQPLAGLGAPRPQLQRVHGRCPGTLAPVTLACLPLAGFLITVQYTLRSARCYAAEVAEATAPPVPAAAPQRLWLLNADAVSAASAAAQAQAQGWQVTTMPGPEDALRRLRGATLGALPSRVIAFPREGPKAAADAEALASLRRRLPAGVETIAAVPVGSLWLADPDALPGYALRCPPFTPDDWRSAAMQHEEPRPRVVVADADDVARCLVLGLAENLGCEVHGARDVGQAMDACLRFAPAVVVTAPSLPGAAPGALTRRLRRLQFGGLAPPARIVVHAAGMTQAGVEGWLADGIDGVLPKPLSMQALRAELGRWCGGRGPGALVTAAPPAPSPDGNRPLHERREPRPAADGGR